MSKDKPLHEYGLDEEIPVIYALVCAKCEDAIISRAQHDFRSCGCGALSVDGGFESYGGRIIGDLGGVKHAKLIFNLTRRKLYDDWNKRVNRYGLWKKREWIPIVLEIKDLNLGREDDEGSDNGDSEAESD